MIVAVLGAIDIIGSVLLFLGKSAPHLIAYWIGVIILLKGISSILGGAASGFYFDIFGAVDLIVGLSLFFSWNLAWFWWAPMIKGLISVISGLAAK